MDKTKMSKEQIGFLDVLTQFALPALTIGGYLLVALQYPQWGLIVSLASEPFWMYSSWKSYKEAGQIGILITTIIITIILIFGVINYWFI